MREHIHFHDFTSPKDLQAENATQNQFQARGEQDVSMDDDLNGDDNIKLEPAR